MAFHDPRGEYALHTLLNLSLAPNQVAPGALLFGCGGVHVRCALCADGAAPPAATSGVGSVHAVMLAAERAMRDELAADPLGDTAIQLRSKVSAGGTAAIPRWFATRYQARRTSDASSGGVA